VSAPENRTEPILCPSARPETPGAVIFGVVGGTVGEPVVTYLSRPLPATPEVVGLAAPVEPDEVFRFAAPCAEDGCQHFRESACDLTARISNQLEAAVEILPHCSIRRSCRWWQQEGRSACRRCPMIVTRDYAASADLRRAAEPAGG
jgi:hypothetical protein